MPTGPIDKNEVIFTDPLFNEVNNLLRWTLGLFEGLRGDHFVFGLPGLFVCLVFVSIRITDFILGSIMFGLFFTLLAPFVIIGYGEGSLSVKDIWIKVTMWMTAVILIVVLAIACGFALGITIDELSK